MTVERADLPVRLVVLDHDGGDLTLRCLEHLQRLEWPADRLEIVCIDNASSDGTPDRIAERFPDVRLLRNETNSGFGANNLGLTGLDGIRAVGLVNNDAFVETGWLRELVQALDADPGVGAVCPKIILDARFCAVDIEARPSSPGVGDGREVGVRLRRVEVDGREVSAVAHFGASGWGREVDRDGGFEWSRPRASLRVPAPTNTGPFTVRLVFDAPSGTVVRLDGGCGVVEHRVGTGPVEVLVDGERFDVLDNIGSFVLEDGHGVDRGRFEVDDGRFDEAVEVFAWCGGGVLLRPEYLDDVGILDERFFLYYEDTDLSWRGRARGWRYRTVPSARMRHVRSASTGSTSDLTIRLSERNRLVLLVRNASTRRALRQFVRYPLSTASYVRRDVVGRLLRGRRPETATIRRRLAAYGGAIGALRWSLPSRRVLRRRRLVPDRTVERGLGTTERFDP